MRGFIFLFHRKLKMLFTAIIDFAMGWASVLGVRKLKGTCVYPEAPLRSSQTMLEQTSNSIHISIAQTVLQIPPYSLSSFILIRTPGRGPPPSEVMIPFADGEIVTQKQKMTWPKLTWPMSGRAQYTAQFSNVSTIPRNSNLP